MSRVVLAGLAAVAALTLCACGSTSPGTASPGTAVTIGLPSWVLIRTRYCPIATKAR